MTEQQQRLESEIGVFQQDQRRATFTLEHGHGETYDTGGRPVLYGHGTYERSSVLTGQSLRHYFQEWNTWEEARQDLAAIGLDYEDWEDGGNTHIPVDLMTAHLPDDSDY